LGQLVKQASALMHERGHASPQIVTNEWPYQTRTNIRLCLPNGQYSRTTWTRH